MLAAVEYPHVGQKVSTFSLLSWVRTSFSSEPQEGLYSYAEGFTSPLVFIFSVYILLTVSKLALFGAIFELTPGPALPEVAQANQDARVFCLV